MRNGAALACAAALFACAKSAPPPPPSPAPSFRRDVLPWMARNCAQAKGCHGDQPTDSVDLDLRPRAAWAQLVNHPAEARRGALRVKPGDPAASFLIDKLAGSLGPREGKTMPIDADTGAPTGPVPFDPAFLENTLKPWIAAGSPDD